MLSLTINGREAPAWLEGALFFLLLAIFLRGAIAFADDVIAWRRARR